MAIEKLAGGAIATLGAYQTLTDPAALVKELIDNALDANATSVAIEISSNTLDVIQLRDNGHGIAPDDRAMVARPNCTSKLHDFDDLKALGGSTLGFRGQALASAAEMSGTLAISTRVEGEQVAAALKINQLGEVVGQERASLPVGTTVRVTDFIKSNPVRRQRAVKDAERCLKHIKQTLQAYAFARPYVRLSLRVLKTKNDKSNFIYASKPGGNVEDAALKVIGSACVSQCILSVVEDQGFTLQAFVPRPDGDAGKISNFGTFLSVDGRPVSATRGTLKQLVKIYRDALKKSNASLGGVKDPFMYLSIACPRASYDPNVEPAKDDVLFENADTVVELARQLFAGVYPPTAIEVLQPRGQVSGSSMHNTVYEHDDGFVTSLEPQRTPRLGGGLAASREVGTNNMPTPLPTNGPANPTEAGELPQQRAFRSNMHGCDEEDLHILDARPPTGRTEVYLDEIRQAQKDVTTSNPWVMAKMNTSLRRPVGTEAEEVDNRIARAVEPLDIVAQSSLPMHAEQALDNHVAAQGLPTPRPSSPSPPIPDFHPSDHVPDIRLARDGRVIGSQALPPPRSHEGRTPGSSDAVASWVQNQWAVRESPAYNTTLTGQAQSPPAGTPLHAIPDTSRRSPRKRMAQTPVNRQFVSPLVDWAPKERVWFDHLEDSTSRKKQKRQHEGREDDGYLVRQGELGDLIDDPRQLTPPRRNRDIRDFVGSVDLTAADSASSFIERRNYAQVRPTRPASQSRSIEGVENTSPSKAVPTALGFMPVSELVALEAHFGSPDKATARPPKRRKTSEGRFLRELSANGPTTLQPDDEDEDQAPIGSPPPSRSRQASRRRRATDNSTGKVQRTKSSRLPLERIPKGQGIHDLEAKLTTSVSEISRLAGKIDEEATLLGWNQPAVDAYDALAVTPDAAEVGLVAGRLQELLINHVSDGEMVQNLGELIQSAFMARDAQPAELDGVLVG
ncbi:hypothetical protein B0A55_00061 [Friedmanniomyces simplex]|uniref:DNA mismatch repair protein S5 domain-containing protein n=1 Tax=Friedmanniomyces simplex TaxID=329884 RepID=A0A4V5NKX4_9PEZI|nr:hypothetical protein B0A55_00061 [Friedmanniomyces simplex]